MIRVIGLLGCVFLSGCATFKNDNYGCTGLPTGVRCTAARDLYDVTNGGEVPRANALKTRKTNDRDPEVNNIKKYDEVGGTRERTITDPVIDTFVTPNLPNRPIPIRTPAQVMRIWVASWEDTSTGALIAPGYIYTEIEPRRWVIGKPESAASQQNRLFKPLENSSLTSSSQKK